MNDWELSGVLIRMGDEIARLAKQQNNDVDFYGRQSTEAIVDRMLMRQSIKMLNMIAGFECVLLCKVSGHYYRMWLTYSGKKLGLPWEIMKREEVKE